MDCLGSSIFDCKTVFRNVWQQEQYTPFYEKLMSSLSTESFIIFPLFSIVMRTIVYCISIVIGKKSEYKFLIKEFLITKMCARIVFFVESF